MMRFQLKPVLAGIGLSLASVMLVGCGDQGEESQQSSQTDPAMTAPNGGESSTADVKQKVGETVEAVKEKTAETTDKVVEETKEMADKASDEIKQASDTVSEKTAKVTQDVKEEASEQVQEAEQAVVEDVASGGQLYSTCVGCHGANGEGGVGPKLAGQAKDDLVSKMLKYKAGEEIGPMSAMMIPQAQQLSEPEIEAVAQYITTF
ncbi:MAG: c-type cytochrome [Hydrogenovibrio sp.]|uniref:c-type cytochrome n=1 Tax=Hydrogenovibrio TaxID=28884 RepID=UPI000370B3D6|nr:MULTISPECIES: c-type cytochrome [Hydrogenovibrio]MDR9497971.1 c-type cytochrome [Hydrogenovibrio sp.]